jgi:hypothetical protein
LLGVKRTSIDSQNPLTRSTMTQGGHRGAVI